MSKQDSTLSQDLLCEIFEYKDGELYWKTRTSIRIVIGKKVGYLDKDGYTYTRINGKYYGIHRLIFMMFNGYVPELIDHIDRNPTNNRIENLRSVTKSENALNSKISSTNTTGVKGVSWHKAAQKYHARITINGVCINLGLHKHLQEAKKAISEFKIKNNNEFINLGY
jgi:hypothetical protein